MSDQRPKSVLVATWNLLDKSDSLPERMAEASAWLAETDIILVQENRHEVNSLGSSAHLIASELKMRAAALTTMPAHEGAQSFHYGTAIISRFPVENEAIIIMPPDIEGMQNQASYAEIRLPSGKLLLAVSAHLEWGGTNERLRLAQASYIDYFLNRKILELSGEEMIAVLGMDGNCLPHSDTIRYLTGVSASAGLPGTYWVDAWAHVGEGEGWTSIVAGNPYAETIAASKGLVRMDLLPKRRIDYLLVKDWVYGRAGSPVSAETLGATSLLGKTLASDHLGVSVRLLDI